MFLFLGTVFILSLPGLAECTCRCRVPDRKSFSERNTRRFDPEVAWRLIQHSSAVYSEPREIEDWTCKTCRELGGKDGFTLEKYVEVRVGAQGKTAFYIGYDRLIPGIVISFRGTESKGNMLGDVMHWRADFEAPFDTARKFGMPVPERAPGNMVVHTGFSNFYQALQGSTSQITESLQKLLRFRDGQDRYLRGHVYFTGHSLGGGLSVLAAADLAPFINSFSQKHYHEAHRRPIVYTFGAPRAGDICLVQFYHRHVFASFRLVHTSKDVVPKLGPKNFKLPFKGCQYAHVLEKVSLANVLADWSPVAGGHGKAKYFQSVQDLYCKTQEITGSDAFLSRQLAKKLAADASIDYMDD